MSTSSPTQVPEPAAVRTALATSPRPPQPGPLSTALTFGWRGMLKIKHVPEQLLDVMITPVLFTVMFTYIYGGAISGSTGEYLQFILPGTLVMSVLFTTVYSGVALNTDLTKGVVDRFRSLPIWRAAPLVGFMALFPLLFLSNAFVPPDTLPRGLKAFVDVNPVSQLVTAARELMNGTASVGEVAIPLAIAAGITAVFLPLTVRLYRTRG